MDKEFNELKKRFSEIEEVVQELTKKIVETEKRIIESMQESNIKERIVELTSLFSPLVKAIEKMKEEEKKL